VSEHTKLITDETVAWITPTELECSHDDAPRCPHCGYRMQDVCDLYGPHFQHDDDTAEVECDCCERTFAVVLHVSHSFSTKAVQ